LSEQNFRTLLKIKGQKNKIDYKSNIVLFGSCFSENIGDKFSYFRFNQLTNPYGILFNPKSIEIAISECVQKKQYTEENLFFFNEQWHSYQHHSDFSNSSLYAILNNINATILVTYEKIKQASHIIITLGTSWVYQTKEKETIVANCHKVPQKQFSKKLLSVPEISKSLDALKKQILKINPSVIIIFTVSPVRHLKDGMIENTLSKAHLLTAIHQETNDLNSFYFPSYEIVLDDLRDYRFYEKDMLHPNETAIDYIWEVFKKTWVHTTTDSLQKEIDIIQKGLKHRPFNPKSISHEKFRNQLQSKIENLKKTHNINI